jgi:ankyrin repeat protein
VKDLIAAGADVNLQLKSKGLTALHWVWGHNQQITQMLLDAGADPNIKD